MKSVKIDINMPSIPQSIIPEVQSGTGQTETHCLEVSTRHSYSYLASYLVWLYVVLWLLKMASLKGKNISTCFNRHLSRTSEMTKALLFAFCPNYLLCCKINLVEHETLYLNGAEDIFARSVLHVSQFSIIEFIDFTSMEQKTSLLARYYM